MIQNSIDYSEYEDYLEYEIQGSILSFGMSSYKNLIRSVEEAFMSMNIDTMFRTSSRLTKPAKSKRTIKAKAKKEN